nr:MAG TPA: hypothetical protein [Caudoviricetes sp.]
MICFFLLLSNETGLTGTTATPMNPCKSKIGM